MNKWKSNNYKIKLSGLSLHVTISKYEDGRIRDVFIHAAKVGSTIRGLLTCFARMISIGLEAGIPVKKIIEQFKDQDFAPHGYVDCAITNKCKSVVDVIAQIMDEESK